MSGKKGFTLIEIIVCIVLISLMLFNVIIVFNREKKVNIENITKEILKAGNVYIESEKDENGKKYNEEILKGAKGVKIPLTNLVNKGYVDENLRKKVYNYAGKLDKNKDYYVMFVLEDKHCAVGQLTAISSWMDKGKDIYLCKDYTSPNKEYKTLIDTILSDYEGKEIEYKKEINDSDWYFSHAKDNGYIVSVRKNGLFKKNNNIYYFRGVVGDNYLKTFRDYDGTDIYRIISFDSETMEVNLIKENSIYVRTLGTSNINCNEDSNEEIINKILKEYYDYMIANCSNEFSEENCNKILKEKSSLLSLDDAEYSGVFVKRRGLRPSCNLNNNLNCNLNDTHINEVFINSGSSTLLKSDTIYYNNFLSNDFKCNDEDCTSLVGSQMYRYLGTLIDLNIEFCNNNILNTKYHKYIRPVITVDGTTKVKGKGTEVNPYEFIVEES